MSRGLGRIQQAVVAELTKLARWKIGGDVDLIASGIYKTKPSNLSPGQINTVHRAVKGLAAKNLIKLNSKITDRGKPTWILAVSVQPTRKRGAPTPKPNLSAVS